MSSRFSLSQSQVHNKFYLSLISAGYGSMPKQTITVNILSKYRKAMSSRVPKPKPSVQEVLS